MRKLLLIGLGLMMSGCAGLTASQKKDLGARLTGYIDTIQKASTDFCNPENQAQAAAALTGAKLAVDNNLNH